MSGAGSTSGADGVVGYDAATLEEARRLGPGSYPSRAFYGRYLHDSFQRVVARAPDHVTVRVHRSRAVAMADTHGVPGGPQGVRLEDGTRLNHLDGVVLAQGHVPARLTAREARTASLARIHNLRYVTPANPADLDLSGIEPGQHVLLRGLGLNFFDHVLPQSVLERKKSPYPSTQDVAYVTALRDKVEALLAEDSPVLRLVPREGITRLLERPLEAYAALGGLWGTRAVMERLVEFNAWVLAYEVRIEL